MSATTSIRVNLGHIPTPTAVSCGRELTVGVLLLLALAFATATVFVRAAWALQSFQIGIYALLAGYLLWNIRGLKSDLASGLTPWLVYLMPVWGVVQILARTTTSTFDTRQAVLRWGSLAAIFLLAQVAGQVSAARRIMLIAMAWLATIIATLCLTQLFTSEGRVLWIFSTGYPDVYATFPSHNNYAQFAEIVLPIALWYAVQEGWRCWWYGLCGGAIYASVIGCASRAGAILCTAEFLVILVLGLFKTRREKTASMQRSATSILIAIPLLAVIFTSVVGWQRVLERFKESDPYFVRREFIVSAIEMAAQRPLTGFGLDTFPEVYRQHAIRDFPFTANHTHNDWAEFLADGGIPFLLLILIPCAAVMSTAFRHPWGLGLIAIMLHACVDYPFPRPAVSGWIFMLLGFLYMARADDRRNRFKERTS